jgi:Domain of unknown function (DUF4149)
MAWVRLLSALVLAFWVGGLAAMALSGSTVFEILERQDPAHGRALAGVLFGTLVAKFQRLSWMLGGASMLLLGVRAFIGPRPRRLALRMWALAALVALNVATSLYLTPKMAAIRDAAGGVVSQLPDADPQRVTFNRLHAISNALVVVTILSGIGLIYAEQRDGH